MKYSNYLLMRKKIKKLNDIKYWTCFLSLDQGVYYFMIKKKY